MQDFSRKEEQGRCSPAKPTGDFILLHKVAKNPCPSDDPNADSCACIFYGIIIFWARSMDITLRTASLIPDTPAINLLATLKKAVNNLPALSEASEVDKIAIFSQNVPANLDKEDAWEFLDPILNRFLGFDRTVESISEELQGGEMGLAAVIRYLKDFVTLYQIDRGLLEGKVQRLLDAIQMW